MELRAVVEVAPEITTPVVLKEVAAVPPPAINAVEKEGSDEAPLDTKGTPAVADGATFVMVAVPAPTSTL